MPGRPPLALIERATTSAQVSMSRFSRAVDAGDLVLRNGEHAEGIIVPQVGLGGEGKFGEIAQILEIVRMHARRIELRLVVRHVLVGMAQGPSEALALPSGKLIP
jgi:hypothetical protein